MANKMGLSVPLKNASYSFEYRDTGGAWSTPEAMTGGANNVYRGFTSPVCDELRITATSTVSAPIDRIHLAGLSISSGLVFDSSSGLVSEPQPVITRLSETNHYTFKVTETDSTSHSLTITGIGQQKLDIRQIIFAKLTWSPDYNYDFGSTLQVSNSFQDQQSFDSRYQRKTFGGRSQTLQLNYQSEETLLDLAHLIKNLTCDGFCLFERDTETTPIRQDYHFAIQASMSGITDVAYDKKSTELTIKEAFNQ